MNKLAIALSAALSLGAVASASAQDATINFVGNITATSCDIAIGGEASSSTVTLPTLGKAALATPDAGIRKFSVTLGDGTATGCSGNTAELIFDKSDVDETTGRLTNQHVGTTELPAAEGVDILIRDGDGTAINLSTKRVTADKKDNNFAFSFQALYHVVDKLEDVEAGRFTAALPFIVEHY
ncbi:type 1 fimbrial protein [Stenotrophomonas maltophilia]|uniref:Type 1 fimbrial protein n=1 Tax=Stenotrophomonas riyadhensis TaxID=2859893 RepID=A0ABT2XCS1_9GAMM|nr:fimbrial protein [Stenotrophomonas sp. CFS3442]MBH1619503.1 type 1 fimbrial protein [Stenotrophomonas maltophilia]MCV0323733.1 type 1 fimbrial protein [Stenotrophomonas sp. CFS3442]HEL4244668.1 type 1 fimbrial protein [Stenotrophomonas maltophilia]